MNKRTYDKLLRKLDQDLAELRNFKLALGRIKEIHEELSTLKQQREGLQERLHEFKKLDADGKIAEVRKHIEDIESEESLLRMELLKLDPSETEEFDDYEA